jgi:hypothetical protein
MYTIFTQEQADDLPGEGRRFAALGPKGVTAVTNLLKDVVLDALWATRQYDGKHGTNVNESFHKHLRRRTLKGTFPTLLMWLHILVMQWNARRRK